MKAIPRACRDPGLRPQVGTDLEVSPGTADSALSSPAGEVEESLPPNIPADIPDIPDPSSDVPEAVVLGGNEAPGGEPFRVGPGVEAVGFEACVVNGAAEVKGGWGEAVEDGLEKDIERVEEEEEEVPRPMGSGLG